MRRWTLCSPSPVTYITILQPATLTFQADILIKTCIFMLQAWKSYCKEHNTTLVLKSEFKLYGWVRDTKKAYKQYINNNHPQ
jgi:hypothetical protein